MGSSLVGVYKKGSSRKNISYHCIGEFLVSISSDDLKMPKYFLDDPQQVLNNFLLVFLITTFHLLGLGKIKRLFLV